MGHGDPEIQRALRSVSLDDKYDGGSGVAYLSGTQALVRLLLNQGERDRRAGLRTGGFVSGYRGSPLSGLDQALWGAQARLEARDIRFQPAINEDLAATACWGTQQLALFPEEARVDGVFALWYGKGPGVDRSGDALKHGNGAGTSRLGGVLVLAADDHTAKSSTFGHQSEQALVAAFIPVLYPSSVQEYLDLGVHGWAMSRHSGLWVGMKCVSDVVETTAVADVDPQRVTVKLPDAGEAPPRDLHIRWPDVWAEQEPRIVRHKLPAVLDYCRANGLNTIALKTASSRLGIVCAGKSYNDVREALRLLGWTDAQAAERGVAVLKLGMVWPLEPEIVRAFASGLDELLVVEEKRPLIEQQLKDELYADAVEGRKAIRISGKSRGGIGGEWSVGADERLLRSDYELTPPEIAAAIAERLGLPVNAFEADPRAAAHGAPSAPAAVRKPYFCSGCPHNTSTVVPEGSRAMAGIGCHYMANWMDRDTKAYTHMGAEGVPWIAQRLFSTRRHIFVNLGDGTYFHSGSLAIRQAVAADACVTYKVLFNDAVAMTGGQPVEGQLTVSRISEQVAAEGVRRIAVVSDDIGKYRDARTRFAAGTTVHERGELDRVQRQLAAFEGVSVLIYDQTCASEKRRRRKRGSYPDPAIRYVINPEVCEGCGDCSVKSNCLSVEPLETELERKRRINQSSCNKDFSCAQGFCPSFVAVKGGKLRSSPSRSDVLAWEPPPEPVVPELDGTCGILVNGVGGTGVVTIGSLIGMAAHLSHRGCSVLDMAGLAQKGGAVWSHVQLAPTQSAILSSRIASAQADVLIGCDLVVSAHPDSLARLREGRTRAVVNLDVAPTSEFVKNADWKLPTQALKAALEKACGADVQWLKAQEAATWALGDAIYANLVMLGFAWQKGWIPLSSQALERAIELNGQQVEKNKQAFRLGRWWAHDAPRVLAAMKPASTVQWLPRVNRTPEDTVARLSERLVAYQGPAYARRFAAFVQFVDSQCADETHRQSFVVAVAQNLFKLMAYKDEYEVARLHSDPEFMDSIRRQFDGEIQLQYHLAPPLLAKKNDKGELQKTAYGAWMGRAFRVLRHGKVLRGTPFDIFGYTHERRTERALVEEYRAAIGAVLAHLGSHASECLELARLPQQIRGYGHVKKRAVAAARARQAELFESITGKPLPAGTMADGYGKYLEYGW